MNAAKTRILLIGLALLSLSSTPAQDRSQARSMVITTHGIVATEHPIASQIGAAVLADGGNAMDAALAANAAMGLFAPMANGIGGDMFAIIYEAKSGKLYGLNASGWSPKALTPDFLKTKGFQDMPQSGIQSVTVPGVVDGLDKLNRRFGRKKLARLLAPVIRYAEEGYPVTEIFDSYWVASEKKLRKDPEATRVFLPSGKAPEVGALFKNPDLAWSLRQIASEGRKAFYEGEIGKRILKCSESLGGTMTREDLAQFSSQWVEPISADYRGWTVSEMPPNGQGIAALLMLKLMERFPMDRFGPDSVDALHVMIEAKKLAYADMVRYVCDPRFNKIPVAGLLSNEYADERSRLLDMGRANPDVPAGQPPRSGSDTTYLCVVDKEGNMVSYIQSNYNSFGSGVVPPGVGFALQNRGGLFSFDPASPNFLAGRKRPLHTIIPGFMRKGDVRIAFGIMGGWNQAQAHAQFVSDIVDHKLNLQAALELPRFTKMTFTGNDVMLERRVPEEVRRQLAERGHKIEVLGDFAANVGGGQAVLRDFKSGINYGASDPRKDGAAIPEP